MWERKKPESGKQAGVTDLYQRLLSVLKTNQAPGGFRCEDPGNSIFGIVSLSYANIYFHAPAERKTQYQRQHPRADAYRQIAKTECRYCHAGCWCKKERVRQLFFRIT